MWKHGPGEGLEVPPLREGERVIRMGSTSRALVVGARRGEMALGRGLRP
jgi:DNA-binding transcriptional MocR family regulator